MFNYLYKKYKVDVLKANNWLSIKELKTYEKIFLVMIILGGILSGVFSLTDNSIGSYISLVMIFIGFVLILIFRSTKKQQLAIVKERVEPMANDRMQKVVRLLIEFNIDISKEEQLNNLIEQAKKEQAEYDVWKGFKKAFSGMTTYILLPILTILLADFFKEAEGTALLTRAFSLMLVCTIIVLLVSAFAININDILNPDIKNLNYFIHDIEDVKLFSNMADRFAKDNKKG